MKHIDEIRNVLPNGLTLLQINPDAAAYDQASDMKVLDAANQRDGVIYSKSKG